MLGYEHMLTPSTWGCRQYCIRAPATSEAYLARQIVRKVRIFAKKAHVVARVEETAFKGRHDEVIKGRHDEVIKWLLNNPLTEEQSNDNY